MEETEERTEEEFQAVLQDPDIYRGSAFDRAGIADQVQAADPTKRTQELEEANARRSAAWGDPNAARVNAPAVKEGDTQPTSTEVFQEEPEIDTEADTKPSPTVDLTRQPGSVLGRVRK